MEIFRESNKYSCFYDLLKKRTLAAYASSSSISVTLINKTTRVHMRCTMLIAN
jgi:hypothetical protein